MNTSFFNTTAASGLAASQNAEYDEYRYIVKMFHILGCILAIYCPIVVISNLLLIVAILKNRALRLHFSHLVIVSIALADLLMGLLGYPYEVDRSIHNRYRGGCRVYLPLDILESYVHVFVSLWGIVILNVHYRLVVMNRIPDVSPMKRKCGAALALIMPWLVSCIILPIAYSNGVLVVVQYRLQCYFVPFFPLRATIFALSFILPSSVIFIQILLTAVLHCRHLGRVLPPPTHEEELPLKVLTLASLATVFLTFAEAFSDCGLHFIPIQYGKASLTAYFSAHMVADTKPLILPLIWFLSPGIRAAVNTLIPRTPCRNVHQPESRADLTVSYVTLVEEH